ncbi:hypothetical protein SFIMM107S_05638 [Streptomyces griseus]
MGTSTPLNDAMETTLISRLFPHRPPVTAPKGVVGHTLAAAGAIEAVATVLTLERSVIPPIANLDALPDAFPLDCVTKEPRHQRVERACSATPSASAATTSPSPSNAPDKRGHFGTAGGVLAVP